MKGTVVWMFTLWSVSSVRGGLLDYCPDSYSINRTFSSKQTTIFIKENQRVCDRIIADTSYQMVSNDDLLPIRSVIKKGGEYFLKFTWESSVIQGQFPRTFLLLLEYSIPKMNITHQWNCVVLKLQRRKAEQNETSSHFSFDCIKLLDDPQEKYGYVSIQIWNKSDKRYNSGCRRSRALQHRNTCKKVECSDERRHSLSLDSYKTEICACYKSGHGPPKVDTQHILGDKTIGFQVTVSNLPDFLLYVNFRIYRDDVRVWNTTFDKHSTDDSLKNGTVKFIANEINRIPGNYSLVFTTRCSESERLFPTSAGCSIRSSYTIYLKDDHLDHIKEPITGDIRTMVTMIGILAGLCVNAILTSTVFFYCRRRKQNRSESYNDSRPRRQPLNSSLIRTAIPEERLELLNSRTWDPGKTLLLCHQADLCSTLAQLLQALRIKPVTGSTENWHSFAIEAMSNVKYSHVLVFMSDGLVELLCGDDHRKEARLTERHFENVPAVVLENLKVLCAANRSRKDFFVHVVSVNSYKGRELTSQFLAEFNFLSRVRNCCVYHVSERLQFENDKEFVQLKNNLNSRTVQFHLSDDPKQSTD